MKHAKAKMLASELEIMAGPLVRVPKPGLVGNYTDVRKRAGFRAE